MASPGPAYSNAGGKRRYLAALSGTQRIRAAISEPAAPICSKGPGAEVGLAIALAASATKAQTDDLIGLLDRSDRGESRLLVLRPIKRLGGHRGLEVLQRVESDPVLGAEASHLLKRLRARKR